MCSNTAVPRPHLPLPRRHAPFLRPAHHAPAESESSGLRGMGQRGNERGVFHRAHGACIKSRYWISSSCGFIPLFADACTAASSTKATLTLQTNRFVGSAHSARKIGSTPRQAECGNPDIWEPRSTSVAVNTRLRASVTARMAPRAEAQWGLRGPCDRDSTLSHAKSAANLTSPRQSVAQNVKQGVL
jgi:hypothetical protein